MLRSVFPAALLLALVPSLLIAEEGIAKVDVFVAGQDGYHTYRIPSLIKTNAGTLLAFCEGRREGQSDAGNIDLLVRRSVDGGKTWSPTAVVWDDGANTCGNPCPLVLRDSTTLVMLMTWNAGNVSEIRIQPGLGTDSRRVFICRSTDDGVTWSTPEDITPAVKRPEWSWYATGPGAGIQIVHGPHAGRLIVPCDHKEPRPQGIDFFSHVIYSDDLGLTWQLGGRSPQPATNECEVVELAAGRLLLNMRSYNKDQRVRQVCTSDDGGVTWQDQRFDSALVDPVCQASIRRLTWPGENSHGLIGFTNAAHPRKRQNLTLRLSSDDAQTWSRSLVIEPGAAAYSCLCSLDDRTLGCLYERGNYAAITLAIVPLARIP